MIRWRSALSAVHFAAENDRGGGFFDTVDTADLIEQLIQLLGRLTAQPGHVVEFATHGTQLLDLRHAAQSPYDFFARAWLHGNPDVGLQPAINQTLA